MDINIGFNYSGGIASIFKNFKFLIYQGDGTAIVNNGFGDVADDSLIQSVQLDSMQHDYDDEDTGMPVFTQRISVKFKNEATIERINEMLDGIGGISEYSKCVYNFSRVDHDIADESDTSKNTLFRKTKSHSYYNFSIPLYDKLSKNVTETAMPSALIAQYHKRENTDYSKFLMTKGGTLPDQIAAQQHTSIFPSMTSNNQYTTNQHSFPAYFDDNYYISFAASDGFISTPFQNRLNYFVSTNMFGIDDFWYDLPFYNKIILPTAGTNFRMRKAILGNRYEDIIMKSVHYSEPNSIQSGYRSWDIEKIIVQHEEYLINGELYEPYTVDGISLLPDIQNSLQNVIGESKTNQWIDAEYNILNELADFAQFNTLDLNEMYYHELNCEYELLFHRIIKTRQGRTTPVQNFHVFRTTDTFLNTSELFYDTQVRHGTQYAYNFYPCSLQITHEVEAVSVEFNDSEQDRIAAIKVEIRPKYKIIELDVGAFSTTVVEPPPRKPVIKFSNYVNENNKIKINLSDRTGRLISEKFRKEKMPISEQDQLYIDKLYLYNKSRYSYVSDVASYGIFEIYRTTERPKSMEDFEGQLLQIVQSTAIDKFERKKIKKFYTIHNLEHGKTYYYLFRALSHDTGFSDFSPVYEVLKVKDSDETILTVSSFHLTTKTKDTYSTSFRKFLKLSIPEYHMVIKSKQNNTEVQTAFGADVDISLGETDLEDNLWSYNDLDSKFIKLRIESKSTGKKIDFNLVFDHNQPENN